MMRWTELDRMLEPSRRLLLRQFLGFAAVGVVGTAAHFATLLVLVQKFRLDPVWSSVIGFIVGAVVNYLLSYRVVFRSRKRHVEAMGQFFTVAGVGLLLNAAIMAFAVQVLNLHYLLSQILATGMVLLWNFAGNRFWTFR
jgi:putative flippase GtrA